MTHATEALPPGALALTRRPGLTASGNCQRCSSPVTIQQPGAVVPLADGDPGFQFTESAAITR
jgi:hypothetical protein